MRKALVLGLIVTNTIFVFSCNSGEATTKVNGHAGKAVVAQEHSYTCPMHPEVTGKAGDKCPKCGMALEPNTKEPVATGNYHMQFDANPSVITPSKEVVLSFTPKKKEAPTEQVVLEVSHEKKMHLILVSDDLSWFDHVHPEATPNGSYTVKTTFPTAGKYKAYADYKPAGNAQIVDKFDIVVEGKAPAEIKFAEEKLSGISGNYSFVLTPEKGQLQTGRPIQLVGVVNKNGQPVDANKLDDYLGAKAHIVVISLNEKEYLHVHPEVVNGRFNIQTTFDKPGIYRGWIQFNGDGKLHTIDFTLNVKQGQVVASQKAGAGNTTHGHNHSGHNH
ncbi:MAG TPA: heavy metal-binding domain-containing protein [Flavisolibacter sp.]|nr:heavy metal-binding domain-containing protein [Flavisolibacter sp.]